MDWLDVGKTIASTGAKLLGATIAGPGGAIISTLISEALGVGDSPDEILNAVKNDPAAVKLAQLESDTKVQLERLRVEQAVTELQEETKQHQASQKTIQIDIAEFRGEASASDAFRLLRDRVEAAGIFVLLIGSRIKLFHTSMIFIH